MITHDTKMFDNEFQARRFYEKLLDNPAVASVRAPVLFKYRTTLGEELIYWEVNYVYVKRA
jgi:hypothetical protein